MKERLLFSLSWMALLSLLLGVIPLASMAVGYQLETQQHRPTFGKWTCDQLAADDGYQETMNAYQESPARFHEAGMRVEAFDPEKCRIAGSGSVTTWIQEGRGMGFIYANLSEREMLNRLGYRSFFHDLSDSRWVSTAIIASPWLPLTLLIYFWSGSVRVFPWRHQRRAADD